MILILEFDLDRVKENEHAKYLGQMTFVSKVIVQTHRHSGPSALPGPIKWSVIMPRNFISSMTGTGVRLRKR